MNYSPARLLCPWDSPGKNTGVVCHFLFQAPLSMGFSRQEYCSDLPFPFPGNLPDSGIEPMSLVSPALAGGFFTTSTWENQDNQKHVDIYTPHNNPKLKTVIYTYRQTLYRLSHQGSLKSVRFTHTHTHTHKKRKESNITQKIVIKL